MTKGRWNSKALAERRRRALNLYIAGCTQEEIAEKVGMHRSVEQSLRMLNATIAGPSCLLPGDPFYSPNPWSVNEEGMWVDSAGMMFNPGPGQFDPRHPPLEKTMSPDEAEASWKDKNIHDPAVDGYGRRLTLFVWRIFAHLNTCRNISHTCRNMPKHASTSPHMPARPKNCLLRSATACVKDTYIAGHAPLPRFRGGRQAGLDECRQRD